MIKLIIFGLIVSLSGCATTSHSKVDAPFALPAKQDEKYELSLARLNQLIARDDLSATQRARFVYERAKLYDAFGLYTLAHFEFIQAVKLQPDMPDVYNYLGIYATIGQRFAESYEHFDSVLELAPDYQFAYLNRGLAFYYSKRYDLANQDFETFYQYDMQDGFRAIWKYFNLVQQNQAQADSFIKQYSSSAQQESWANTIARHLAGQLTQEALIEQAKMQSETSNQYAHRLCEAYFYMAKQEMINGSSERAKQWLTLTLTTGVYDFVEYRYAILEMAKLEGKLNFTAP